MTKNSFEYKVVGLAYYCCEIRLLYMCKPPPHPKLPPPPQHHPKILSDIFIGFNKDMTVIQSGTRPGGCFIKCLVSDFY